MSSHTKTRSKFSDATFNTDPISMEELKGILRQFNRGKAPGPDKISTDCVKDLRGDNLGRLRILINEWWTTRSLRRDLALARVVSLYKKGNPDLQENYRPISLLNAYYKIITAVIQKRLSRALDD